jgi:hypothetical protein
MDFLQEARRWAAEAAGLSGTVVVSREEVHPASPPPTLTLPVLSPARAAANPAPPRSLSDAITRAVQAEARCLALQTALDRYTAQGEVMEVRAVCAAWAFAS